MCKFLRLPVFYKKFFKAQFISFSYYTPSLENRGKGFLHVRPMFDFEKIVNDLALMQDSTSARGIQFDPQNFTRLYERQKNLSKQIQELKVKKEEINQLAKAEALLNKENATNTLKDIRQKSREIRTELKQRTVELNYASEELYALAFSLPNYLHPLSVKRTENSVREKRVKGCINENGNNVSKLITFDKFGHRTGILKTEIEGKLNQVRGHWCLLQNAIGLWISSVLRDSKCFQVSPPFMVNSHIVKSCGQYTEAQVKSQEDTMLNLCGVTTMPFAAYYMMTISNICSLPRSLYTLGPRYHLDPERVKTKFSQAKTIELFGLTKDSIEESDLLCMQYLEILKNLYTSLDLNWRVVENSFVHFSPAMYRKISVEIWLPISKYYLEVGIVYSCTDYISRRLRIQYSVDPKIPASKTKNENNGFVHTVHATCAYVEILMAVLIEYYQNEDGSVSVPFVLKNYMYGIERVQ